MFQYKIINITNGVACRCSIAESKTTAEPQTELTEKITSAKETLTTADILDAKFLTTAQPDKESLLYRITTSLSGNQATLLQTKGNAFCHT